MYHKYWILDPLKLSTTLHHKDYGLKTLSHVERGKESPTYIRRLWGDPIFFPVI